MSLFPAYATTEQQKVSTPLQSTNAPSGLFDWLQNASFTSKNVEALQSIEEEPNLEGSDSKISKEDADIRSQSEANLTAQLYELSETQKKKHKRKEKSSRHKRKKYADEESHESKVEADFFKKKVFIEDTNLRPEHAFRLDRKPDPNNRAFSSLPHNQISNYRRSNVTCLGLDRTRSRIWKRKSDVNERYYLDLKRLYDDTSIVDLVGGRENHEQPEQESVFEHHYLYLPLEVPAPGSTDQSAANPLGIYDPSTTSYLEGKGPVSESGGPDGGDLCDAIRHQDAWTRKSAEFNRHLRENPHDVEAFLKFSQFQCEPVTSNGFVSSAKEQRKKAVEAAVLEKRIAILDSAIEANPRSLKLVVHKLELCKDLWSIDRLLKEWRRVIFVNPNNTWLWQQYLQCFQTHFSSFSVSKFTKLFHKCLDTLRQIHVGTFQSHRPLPHLEEDMIALVGRHCHHLCQAGFREKALAVFQALIEFNFFAPDHMSKGAPLNDRLAFFEPFWDSGIPRFGEPGALGWGDVMKNKQIMLMEKQPQAVASEDGLISKERAVWQNFLQLEEFREQHHWLPWRATELEDECEDLDRTSVFDDVSPVLFCIAEESNRFLLVLKFLEFLGVQIAPHLQSLCAALGCHAASDMVDSSSVLDGHRHFRWRYYSSDRSANVLSLGRLGGDETPEFRSFVDRVLDQSRSLFGAGPFRRAVTLLNVHRKCEAVWRSSVGEAQTLKDCKKFVRTLLKSDENRNDLVLWAEYAKLEWLSDNVEEARRVFHVSTKMHRAAFGEWQGMNVEQRSALCKFVKTHAELELRVDLMDRGVVDREDALKRAQWLLVQLALDSVHVPYSSTTRVTAALLLKAKHRYETTLETLLKQLDDEAHLAQSGTFRLSEYLDSRCHLLVDLTMCSALLECLCVGIEAGDKVFQKVFKIIDAKLSTDSEDEQIRHRFQYELLYMQYIRLHVFHNNFSVWAPISALREALHKAQTLFPENRHFHNLFLDIEAKSVIGMRLRTYYNAQFRNAATPGFTTAIFAAVALLERQKNISNAVLGAAVNLKSLDFSASVSMDTGILNRLKALFERIVNHPNLRHCVLTWRLYLKFEAMCNPASAKPIFYRALRECPWAKVLYMDAVRYFPSDMQEINDLMTEKEIRVRAPLEEITLLMEDDVQGSPRSPGEEKE